VKLLIYWVFQVIVSKIVNGKGAITPNIALPIETVFGGNADFWLRMQRGYDLMEEKIKFSTNPPKLTTFNFIIYLKKPWSERYASYQ